MNCIPPSGEAEAKFSAVQVASEGVLYELLFCLRDDLDVEVPAILSGNWASEIRPGCDGHTPAVCIAAGAVGRQARV